MSDEVDMDIVFSKRELSRGFRYAMETAGATKDTPLTTMTWLSMYNKMVEVLNGDQWVQGRTMEQELDISM